MHELLTFAGQHPILSFLLVASVGATVVKVVSLLLPWNRNRMH
jgi:hypothetical protein